MCNLIDAMMPPPDQNPNDEIDKMDKFMIFVVVWSIGACLIDADKDKFNQFIVSIANQVLPPNSLYDNFFDMKKMNFVKWEDLVPEYKPPPSGKFSQMLVPT